MVNTILQLKLFRWKNQSSNMYLKHLGIYQNTPVLHRRQLTNNSDGEDPQKQSVQHHGHIFPVLLHLEMRKNSGLCSVIR